MFVTEIVGRVSTRTNPPFRPPLTANVAREDLHLLMKMCWNENPDERPEFWEIRKLLKKLHGRKYGSMFFFFLTTVYS